MGRRKPKMYEVLRMRQGGLLFGRGLTYDDYRLRWDLSAKGICVYCWRHGCRTEMDHIDPLSRGGAHHMDNIAFVCGRCNRSKGSRFLLEWVLSNCPGVLPCLQVPK
jgi:5-methylcytosine-specific restriction endonuclease McrA